MTHGFGYDDGNEPLVEASGVPPLGPIEAVEFATSQKATWVMEELKINISGED